ncbi:galactokinase family protein [Brachybacterium rhamnosum]|uniref:Galactokinase family protein n=1 Tax=Brachybacterium rhamnosum TaxID=173361 RepID=A0ABW4PVR0_9MICO
MSTVLEQLRREAEEPTHADWSSPRTATWFVPGRIEVLGKHTDYAGGRSLLAAVDLGHTVRAVERTDRELHVTSALAGDPVVVDLDAPARHPSPPGHWGGYVRTVVERLETNFPGRLRGAEVHVTSTLPLAAGMSSSSALVVGLALALLDLAGVADEPPFTTEITTDEQLGEYLGCVENGQSFGSLAGDHGVGTFGGSEDHTAILCGVEGALVQYSFCPVRREREVALPAGLSLVVAVSGVDAEKTGAALADYNRISLAAREIVTRWQQATGRTESTLADALATGPAALSRLRELVGEDSPLTGRLEQFVAESERIVPAAALALEEGDLAELGSLVDESQAGAETGLGNQIPETVRLQRLARELGAHAASAFGAGFGGSVWALVGRPEAPDGAAGADGADGADGAQAEESAEEFADQFARRWLAAYREEFPEAGARATTLVTRPGPGAHRLDPEE